MSVQIGGPGGFSKEEYDSLLQKLMKNEPIGKPEQSIFDPSSVPEGAITPAMVQRQLVSEFMDTGDLPLSMKISRYKQLFFAGLTRYMGTEFPPSALQQALFKVINGQDPRDVSEDLKVSLLQPKIGAMLAQGPGPLNKVMFSSNPDFKGWKQLSPEEKMDLVGTVMYEQPRMSWKEATTTSTFPLEAIAVAGNTDPFMREAMGPLAWAAAKLYDILTREGVENPTLGQGVLWLDRWSRDAIAKHMTVFNYNWVPEPLRSYMLTYEAGFRTLLSQYSGIKHTKSGAEAIAEEMVEGGYGLGDYLIDPTLGEVVVGSPLANLTGRLLAEALPTTARGIGAAARVTNKLENRALYNVARIRMATEDVVEGLRIRRAGAKASREIEKALKRGETLSSPVLDPSDVPFAVDTMHPATDAKRYIPPKNRVNIEDYPEQFLPHTVEEVQQRRAALAQQFEADRARVAQDPVGAAADRIAQGYWRPGRFGEPVLGFGGAETALGRKYEALSQEYDFLHDRMMRLQDRAARSQALPMEQQQALFTELSDVMESQDQVMAELAKLERANEARTRAQVMEATKEKARQAQVEKIGEVETALYMKGRKVPTVTIIDVADLIDQDIPLPKGVEIEGLPQGVLTVGDDAPVVFSSQILAGAWDDALNRPRIDGTGRARGVMPVTREELDQILAGKTPESPLEFYSLPGAGTSSPYVLHASVPEDVALGIRQPTVADIDVLGLYRPVEFSAAGGVDVYQPIAVRGGMPANVLTSLPTVKGAEEAVKRRLTALERETPVYYTTQPQDAVTILFDGSIRKRPDVVTFSERAPYMQVPKTGSGPGIRIITTREEIERQAAAGRIGGTEWRGAHVRSETLPEMMQRLQEEPIDDVAARGLFDELAAMEAEGRQTVDGDFPVDGILKVEIDPSELSMATGASKEASFEMISTLVKGFESQGIPVEIRPLFLQNEILSFRPYVDMQALPDRLAKGMDSAEKGWRLLSHAATAEPVIRPNGDVVTPVQIAWQSMRGEEYLMPASYPGRAVDDAFAIVPYERRMGLSEEARDYFDLTMHTEHLTPDQRDVLRSFYPDPTPSFMNFGHPIPPDLKALGLEPPYSGVWEDTRILPSPAQGNSFGDIGFWGEWIDEPIDALSKTDHPNAKQILNIMSRRDFDKAQDLVTLQQMAKPIEDWIAKDFATRDRKALTWFNIKPGTVEYKEMLKSLTPEEFEIYRQVRKVYDHCYQRMRDTGVLERYKELTGQEVYYIQNYGPILYDFDSDVARGATPIEWQDRRPTGNVLFNHLRHRFGADLEPVQSFTQTMQFYISGYQRKMFDEPAWTEMLKLSGNLKSEAGVPVVSNFPEGAALYVQEMVKAQKGYPSRLEQAWNRWMREGTPAAVLADDAVNMGAFISNQFYRGLLAGSVHFWLQNFMTQGVLNPAAVYGPFSSMRGIARHAENAWRGIEPREALLAGFKSIFKDLQISEKGVTGKLASKWRNTEGGRNWTQLMRQIDESVGVTGVEHQMRGISWHIGFDEAKGAWEARNGRHLTIDEVASSLKGEGPVSADVVNQWVLEGVRVSNNVNFLYGVNGQNPRLRNIFGGKTLSMMMQFQTYYGKELAYLYRNSKMRKDPGLILRYFEIMGVMDRMLAMSDIEGEEFNIVNDVSEIVDRQARYSEYPVGIIPSMMLNVIRGVTTDDPVVEQDAIDEFFTDSAGATPFFTLLRHGLSAGIQLDQGSRINPYSGETLRPLEDSEKLALLLGTPSVHDTKMRRLTRDLYRTEKARSVELHAIAGEYMDAYKNADLDKEQRLLDRAAAWGLDISPALDREMKAMVMSRLLRRIEDTSNNIPNEIILDQVRKEFPGIYDPRIAEQFQQYWGNLQERRRRVEEARQAPTAPGTVREELQRYLDELDLMETRQKP